MADDDQHLADGIGARMNKPMKVLIADDHPLVRDGIQHALARIGGQIIVLEASDYLTALDTIARTDDLDLVLADLAMPGMERFEGLCRIAKSAGDVPVVVFSASEDPGDVRRAMRCGIRGYIPKSSANAVLLAALKLVLSGGAYVPPNLLDGHSTPPTNGKADVSLLTRRQREVIALLAKGKSNKEISRELGLSQGTVRSHLEAIFKALGVTNRTQASHVAREFGLIDD